MASNMSTIGFAFQGEHEFQNTMVRLAEAARERLSCSAGEYAIWRSRTGVEIWFHLQAVSAGSEGERGIDGLTPFFEGSHATTLAVDTMISRPGDNAFEGAFSGWVGGDDEAGSYPLVFDAVDFAAHRDRALPATWNVRLSAFARELKAFASVEDYYDARGDEPSFAPQAFVPIGLFAAASEEDDGGRLPPSSQALLTGRVLETQLLRNEETGRAFHWLSVESLGATLDVVADPDIVSGEIVAGGTVEVVCLLFGRILD